MVEMKYKSDLTLCNCCSGAGKNLRLFTGRPVDNAASASLSMTWSMLYTGVIDAPRICSILNWCNIAASAFPAGSKSKDDKVEHVEP